VLGLDHQAARYTWTVVLILLLLGVVYLIRQTLFIFAVRYCLPICSGHWWATSIATSWAVPGAGSRYRLFGHGGIADCRRN
jgi:hypothetical protein